ncbi:MAG TPA: hypothetical protein VKT49_04970 [Bryobacteraceae bacterium]|nr:hypothetical protein [Bryobacteraceae bacterium]
MTGGTPKAKAQLCPEKLRLARVLVAAIRDLMLLHERELASLAEGGEGLQRFGMAINRARAKRDDAKRRYLDHVVAHEC